MEWVAGIVLINTKPCPNQTVLRHYQKDITLIQTNYRILVVAKIKKLPKDYLPVSAGRNESFFAAVYDVVRQIPKGRVTTYGAIGAALGAKSSARMVGWAMNNAHGMKPKVPAHRVINRQGLLTGKMHFADPDQMQQLLEKEGIEVKNDKVQDFENKFWDPLEELGLL